MTIGMLTDNVLLDIFDFYRKNHLKDQGRYIPVWRWHVLVHVCQRWRQIIFESPLRLDLQILCRGNTPVLKNLGIWPAFPIAIQFDYNWNIPHSDDEEDNVIAALEHRDRVCRIELHHAPASKLAKMITAMQESFPLLAYLFIGYTDGEGLVLPGRFLGGSAPCLQELQVYYLPYPSLSTLLLSTNNLIILRLSMASTSIVSPEAMVVALAALPKLETLVILCRPPFYGQNRPPVSRTVLPALTSFEFEGTSEYLEDLVAQMDAPQLNNIVIEYWTLWVNVAGAELPKFVDRSMGPKLTLFKHAEVSFSCYDLSFTMTDWHPETTSTISFEARDLSAPHIPELLGQFSVTEILSNVVHLKFEARDKLQHMDNVVWINYLPQFSAVQSLHVCRKLAGYLARALEALAGETVTEVLPSLNLIRLAGQSASSVEKFVAARELCGRPVTVVDTMTEFSKRLESFVGKYQLEVLYQDSDGHVSDEEESDEDESDEDV